MLAYNSTRQSNHDASLLDMSTMLVPSKDMFDFKTFQSGYENSFLEISKMSIGSDEPNKHFGTAKERSQA